MPAGRPRSEAAQHAILAATRDELGERGYDKLSIDRVAAAAGVGKQTVYRWYPSKSTLVAECLLHGYLTTPAIAAASDGDVRTDIEDWVHRFATTINEPSTLALIRAASAASAEDADIARRFDEQITRTRAALVTRLHQGVEAGQLRSDVDLGVVAEVIVGTLQYRLLTRQEIPPSFVTVLMDILFGGLQDAGVADRLPGQTVQPGSGRHQVPTETETRQP